MNLRLNYGFLTDVFLKFLALHKFFRSDIKDKRTVGSTQHSFNLIDADVAISCCLKFGTIAVNGMRLCRSLGKKR